MIAIIDYGVGNLKSVYKALGSLGFSVKITSEHKDIDDSSGLILPGVGAFKDAMENLSKEGLDECVKRNIRKGKPTLGICLGMQLLYGRSFEDGEWQGLGLLEGDIVEFSQDLKVPHMGWNKLKSTGTESTIGNDINDEEYVYFVHSFYLKPPNKEEVIFECSYGVEFPALIRKDNLVGMQFHPEKSGITGMKLLRNFGEMIK